MTSSLRRRILAGSVLWTIGMILLVSALTSVLFDRYPEARIPAGQHMHGLLQAPIVLAIGAASLVIGALQVRRGLRRLDHLHSELAGLREGPARRLEGTYPSEVQPLVDDLNALLEHREDATRRAIAKAGDLAHGLKTPLAVLAREAELLEAAGHTDASASIRQGIERMRRQVEYHLVHARAAASGPSAGTRADVAAAAEGIARTLRQLHAARGLAIEVSVPASCTVRVQREDLDEMLGNLADNACKWAKSRVLVTASRSGSDVVITVDDDGPGVAEEVRHAVLRRGVRADEATPGTGLGLAIVADLAEIYGGAIALERAPLGGCRAVLRLPA